MNYSSWEIAWQRLDFLQQFSKMGDAITRLRWLSVSDHVPTFCPKSLISVGRPGIEKIENKSGETDCVRSYHVILTILHTSTIWLFLPLRFYVLLTKETKFLLKYLKNIFYIFFNGFVSGLCVIFGVKKYFSAYFSAYFLRVFYLF